MEYSDELLNQLFQYLDEIDFIKDREIPNIPLYMDQVTTFMNHKLKNAARNPEEDKILTKTMINNYAKNNLLPPPIKKKYSKDHILLLTFIYYFKGMLSISDIQILLGPLTELFFESQGDIKLKDVYNDIFQIEKTHMNKLKEDITEKYKKSFDISLDASEEEKKQLQLFYLICELGFDVYLKRLLMEKIIDDVMSPSAHSDTDHKNSKTTKKTKE